jgi:predicted nucleic acid-binding protein
LSRPLVIDASVAVKLLVEEPLSDRARTLFRRLESEPGLRFWAPDHLYAECANVLWKYVRRFGYAPTSARDKITDFSALPFQTVSTRQLAGVSLDLAVEWNVAVYDASYLALALGLGAPLVTADEALLAKVRGGPFEVVWLADLAGGSLPLR